MPVFESRLDLGSDQARANREGHLRLLAEIRALEARIRANSGKSARKFAERGQLLPRDRLDLLLDRGAPFLELSTLVGLRMHDDDGAENASGGGVITGIGMVSGTRCVVNVSDAGIKGGAATPLGVDKTLRAQAIALENRLPYIQLVESAGANLLRQAEMFVRGGRTFANLARLSKEGIPVIAVVHGSSTAGGAYQPGLSDYVVVVRDRSKIFLAGPPLLKAATGEIATDEELGGAELHYTVSGLAEYMAEDDRDGVRLAREILEKINWASSRPARSFRPPAYNPEEILSLVPLDYRKPYDVREFIARLVDGSEWLDFKPDYGPQTVC
ncbi:MAG: acyl-CoA carboxylase subunit beta, partial [Alphaproteobacteria bacterium]|nr:acyl-CoA carboxylase subunit beta [Alphaproteobacteria bacterium]